MNIDNTTIGATEIISKLNEEYNEVVTAILNYSKNRTLLNLKEIFRETYDLIQVCILVLWRYHRQALNIDEPSLIQDINIEHKNKLIEREWTIETEIEIDVKE